MIQCFNFILLCHWIPKRKALHYHCVINAVDCWCHYERPHSLEINRHEFITENSSGRVSDLPESRLLQVPGWCDCEDLNWLITRSFRRHFDPTTWVSCHVAISDDHSKALGIGFGWRAHELLGHVGDGAVNVSAHAQVFDRLEPPDEFILTGDGADNLMLLGEVKASYRPGDLNRISVINIF